MVEEIETIEDAHKKGHPLDGDALEPARGKDYRTHLVRGNPA